MARQVTLDVQSKIGQWEGLVLYAYDDVDKDNPKHPVRAGQRARGTLTIGFGHTGADVKPGQTCTLAQAQQWLALDTAKAARIVENAVKVPLTDNQFGALTAFTLNAGPGGRKPGDGFLTSTLLKKLNAGDYNAVPGELAKWNKTTVDGKKVTSSGLVNRRAAEAGMWATGAMVASNFISASPAVIKVVTKENVSWGTGILALFGSNFTSGPMSFVLAFIVLVTFGIGLWWAWAHRKALAS